MQEQNSENRTSLTQALIGFYSLKTALEKLGFDDIAAKVPTRDEIIAEMQPECGNPDCPCHALKRGE